MGNRIPNLIHLLYIYRAKVVASDCEPEIILTFYKSQVTEMKVYVRKMGNFHRLDLSVP